MNQWRLQWLAPELVRRVDIKLPVQGIVRHDGRASAIGAGLLFVTNLGPYARQSCQPPSPVGADVFAEITQIIVQLAVAIDLTTVIPSLLQQHLLDLHLFRSGLLRAILAIKETGYGGDTQRRV